MKLFLDKNLSRCLIPFLQHDFPDSTQVVTVRIGTYNGTQIREFAKTNSFAFITREKPTITQNCTREIGVSPSVTSALNQPGLAPHNPYNEK
jgi:predicted nuclease of predicted toxin-antitoxin system